MSASTHGPTGSDSEAALPRGAAIGRYVVLRLVGRGGMGEVYAAYDPELDRKVAIKLMRVRGEAQTAADGRTRLLREAQAIAKLSHPNVVVVYDVGTFGDQVFIAMEFVEGHTLAYWMHAQPRGWADVLKVFVAAGRGLVAAHDKELVHRDFKPDNVMITAEGQVRVMDFGLARLAGEREVEAAPPKPPTRTTRAEPPQEEDVGSTRIINTTIVDAKDEILESGAHAMLNMQLTQTGAMLGTPAYMAPEQFLGRPTGPRTDQFSFCVALYEALYGERPFAGESMGILMAAVLDGEIRPAPAGCEVPRWVRKVVLRGLRTAPEERWPSMKHLLSELEKNRVVARRRRFAAAAAAKLAGIWEAPGRVRGAETEAKAEIRRAFMATGKSYAATAYENASRVLDRYAKGWGDMYVEACVATHIRGEQSAEVLDLRMAFLASALEALKALCALFRKADGEMIENAVTAARALPSLDRCADVELLRAIIQPPDDPEARATVERLRAELAAARALAQVGRLSAAATALQAIEQEGRRVAYRPLVAEVLIELGWVHCGRREIENAARVYEEALWMAEACRHDEVVAVAAAQLVGMVADHPHLHLAGEIWARMAETVLTRMGGDEQIWAWLFNNRGNMRRVQGRMSEALADYERALALKERALGPASPDVAYSRINLSICCVQLGDLDGAARHAAQSLEILEASVGPDHPRTAETLMNFAEVLNHQGRFAQACEMARRAQAIFERETEPDGVFVTFTRAQLGIALLGAGALDEALSVLERAAASHRALEADPIVQATTWFALARAVDASGRDLERALELARRARATLASIRLASDLARVDAWLAARPA